MQRRLYDIMAKVVASVPADQRPVWSLERERWRLPYWDWARPQAYSQSYGVPEIVTKEFIPPEFPSPPEENPLWKFTNPRKDESGRPLPMGDRRMGNYAIPDGDFEARAHPTSCKSCQLTATVVAM